MNGTGIKRSIAIVVAGTFALGACGGDGGGGGADEATTTTAAMADDTTTTVADGAGGVDAPDNVDAALEAISIVDINPGAGSGEAELLLSGWPAGLDHFRVSMDDGSGAGAVRLDILDQGDAMTPFLIVSPIPGGDMEFALSWEHTDGRDSAITYYSCSGFRLDTGC